MNTESKLQELLAEEKLLTLAEVGEWLGVPVTRASDLLRAHKFAAVSLDGRLRVPASMLGERGELNKFVAGAITVLVDGGFSDEDIVVFLYAEDESLPGRPIDALHGHGAREVIRRAQAMAF